MGKWPSELILAAKQRVLIKWCKLLPRLDQRWPHEAAVTCQALKVALALDAAIIPAQRLVILRSSGTASRVYSEQAECTQQSELED